MIPKQILYEQKFVKLISLLMTAAAICREAYETTFS